ncbi:MAG: NUDIX domain-containing protein [Chloroflexi bacterium]|nr:NUDIX domain-containing protein [Chloroflexota bacterium]
MTQPASFIDSAGKPITRMPDAIRPATNAAIFNERGEVLLQRRADNGFWGLPGGNVDIGESVEQCAIREAKEETGLDVTVTRFVGVYSDPRYYSILSYPNGYVVHYVTLVFECEAQSHDLAISDESTDIGWFPTSALPENTLLSHHIRIQDALARRAEPFIR